MKKPEPREAKKLEAKLSEEDKSRLIDIISKARAIVAKKETKPEQITGVLEEIRLYTVRAEEERHYLFGIVKYHEERLKKIYKIVTGTKYKPKEKK